MRSGAGALFSVFWDEFRAMTSDDHFGRRVEFIPLHLAIVAFEMQCLQLHDTKD